MAKRKLSDEPDRKFVHETQWTEVTETICVEIKNFTEKIDDLENKKKPIESPKFTVDGKELCVGVFPKDFRENSGEFIGVYLCPNSSFSATVIVSFKSSAGGKFSVKKKYSIKAGLLLGVSKFLSHTDYKKWARENEDIFSLEVEVTVKVKNPSTWTTER